MSDKKYEFTGLEKVNLWGYTVKQIRALVDIPGASVRTGDVGGWIESEQLTNGDARVEKLSDFMMVGPIGSERMTATLFRTKNGKHTLNVGCWTGTIGTLSAEVKRRRELWSVDDLTQEMWVSQYKALKALGKATVASWKRVSDE